MKNGGFESGTLTWTNTPYGNDVTQLSAVVGDYRSAGGVRSGAKSMRVHVEEEALPTSSQVLGMTLRNRVELTAGKTYTFSGYVNTTDADLYDPTSKVYLRVFDPSDTLLASSTDYVMQTSSSIEEGWERLSITFTATVSGNWYVNILTRRIKGKQSWYFDADDHRCLGTGEPGSERHLCTDILSV